MHELWIGVERVDGVCTGPIPMLPGTGFLVRNGSLIFPNGGPVCLYALQSVLPMIPAKERLTDGDPAGDWMTKVHYVQCPDPKGRTVWRIEQRALGSTAIPSSSNQPPQELRGGEIPTEPAGFPASAGRPGDLRITVERIEGRCIEGMCVGRTALVRRSSLYLPQPFCLYALQAIMPLLPAMQRRLEPGDWMATENEVICPDPLGNVILRIEKVCAG
jgi:uncharacterized repeat protein (TIGR04076 family)